MSVFRPRPVYIHSSEMLPIGKYDGHQRPLKSFFELIDGLIPFISAANIEQNRIGCVVVGSQNPFAFSGIDNVAAKVCGRLGISGAKSLLVDTASSSGASAFEAAYLQIASGQHDHVLAIGVQKMSDVTTREATRIVAGVIDREEAEFGLTMPACGALVAQALIEEFKLSPQQWTALSAGWTARAQRFAAQNPDAHLPREIPVEQYLADIETGKNYLYYDPLRYYDFCPMSDGVAACLLSAEPAKVRISGVGCGTDIPTIADRETFTSFPATVYALHQALGMAGLPDLLSLSGQLHVNMHDPFNGFGPINLVDLGLVPRERLLDALLDDELTGPNGRFPTNLTGGLKGRGHPLGATGMVQIVENHRMLCEGRFAAGLSQSIGGPINNNVVILLETDDHYLARTVVPYRPSHFPELGRLKPVDMNIDSLFRQAKKVDGTLLAKTSRHNYKDGAVERVLLLFSTQIERQKYRFLIGIEPQDAKLLSGLRVGQPIRLQEHEGAIQINDVPIRRLYRKTLEGLVDLAKLRPFRREKS